MRTNNRIEKLERRLHLHPISWKDALGSVLGAASRVHHYRDVHTMMMREALCGVDCRAGKDDCNDE